jgi:catalase
MNRDMYNAIANGNFPSWTLNAQIVTIDQAKTYRYNIFDPTKVLPVKDFPLIPIGKLVLNRNPSNYFNDVEQVGFNPGALVPGIEPSPDRVLQGRIFAYAAALRYRLGKNFNQIPVNCPRDDVFVYTYTRDGQFNIYANGDGGPNYYPNSFHGPTPSPNAKFSLFPVEAEVVDRVDTGDEDNFSQFAEYWRDEIGPAEKERTLRAMAEELALTSPRIQEQSLSRCADPVGTEYSKRFRAAVAVANIKLKRNRRSQGKLAVKKTRDSLAAGGAGYI